MSFLTNKTIFSLFLSNFEKSPDEIFIQDDFSSYTYSQAFQKINAIRNKLKEDGVNSGDNIGIILDSQNDIILSILAILSLNAVFVPFSLSMTAEQVDILIENTNLKSVLISKKIQKPAFEGTIDFENIDFSLNDSLEISDFEEKSNDNACILFTSGSTSTPKGVVLTNDNLFVNARMMSRLFELTEKDRILNILPFNADFALTLLYCALFSKCLLISTKKNNQIQVVNKIEADKITVFAAVSCYFGSLIHERTGFMNKKIPSLRLLISGGGQPQKTTMDFLYSKVKKDNFEMFLLYGLTETSWSTFIKIEDYMKRPGALGKPLPDIKLYIKNQDSISADNEKGELIQTGGIIFKEYWKNPQKTASTIKEQDEFFNLCGIKERALFTGDLVHKDEEGFFIYEKRKDDQIKVNGFQFSVFELERTISQIPGILNIAICEKEIAVNDFSYIIFIQGVSGLSKQEALKSVLKVIPKNMYPKDLILLNEMPYSATGKIDKKKLVEDYNKTQGNGK